MIAEVVIPLRTVTGLNAREHWRARARRVRKEREVTNAAMFHATDVHALIRNVRRVTFVRVSPQLCDDDNLAGACKHVRDEIAALLGVSDGPTGGVEWRYQQERGPRGHHSVRVVIETREEVAA